MGIFPITAEEINTLFVKAVSRNDSAIDMNWEANIQGAHLHSEDVYCLTQLIVVLVFVDHVGKPHRWNGRCNENSKESPH